MQKYMLLLFLYIVIFHHFLINMYNSLSYYRTKKIIVPHPYKETDAFLDASTIFGSTKPMYIFCSSGMPLCPCFFHGCVVIKLILFLIF